MALLREEEATMYRLVLAATRNDVLEAFTHIKDVHRLMFEPFTVVDTAQAAIAELAKSGADAIAYALPGQDEDLLQSHLNEHFPHLPIIRALPGEDARNILQLLREHLDQLHGDFSDYGNDTVAGLARLRAELMHRLLEGKIRDREELETRLLMTRSKLSADYPCFLFEFDVPEGEQYLQERWHHGFERLDYALRANFFGRINGALHYYAALVTPSRLRVLAVSGEKLSESEVDVLSRGSHDRVLSAAAQVKAFMDLELTVRQFYALSDLGGVVDRAP
jgi:hypothetical protein